MISVPHAVEPSHSMLSTVEVEDPQDHAKPGEGILATHAKRIAGRARTEAAGVLEKACRVGQVGQIISK